MRRVVGVLAALAAMAVVTPPARATTGACGEVRVPVRLGALAAPHVQAGTLCAAPGARTLQILIPGSTYVRNYWDFGLKPETYSYVRGVAQDGHATLALDPLGRGQSTKPPAAALDVVSQADVVHQLVQAARAGGLGGAPFERVVLVGHSLGSAVALVEAARHGDTDGLLLTGLIPHTIPLGAFELAGALWPAALEPRFAGRPPGYVTTAPGRRWSFYHPPATEPAVVAHDEATKDVVAPGEIATIALASSRTTDEAIRVPVLSVVGDHDRIFCSTTCSDPASPVHREAGFYRHVPCFQTYVLPGSGHVVNLHPSAPQWYARAREWLEAVGAGADPCST